MVDLITDPDAPGYNPTTVVVAGLAAYARGEPVDRDAMLEAAAMIVIANLVDAGISVDDIKRMFDRDYQFRYKYDGATEDLEVSIEFIDAS